MRNQDMRKLMLLIVITALMAVSMPLQGQEDSPKNSATPAKTQPVQPYRLDFSLNELAENKLVNTRHYSMNLIAGNADEIKIGTRVPVVSKTPDPSLVSNVYQ